MLNAEEQGAGRTVVLVHGWPTSSVVWRQQVRALAPDFHVVAVDLPGFGDSPPPKRPTVAELAAELRSWIEQRGLANVLLIGWSMGGTVVLSYCEQFGPALIDGIGIVDVTPKLSPSEDWPLGEGTPFAPEVLQRWSQTWPSDPEAVAAEVYTIGFRDAEAFSPARSELIRESMRANRQFAIPLLEDAFRLDFRATMQKLEIPALLMYGRHSTSTTPFVRGFMKGASRWGKLITFDESGHCIMYEEPDRFNSAVKTFASDLWA